MDLTDPKIVAVIDGLAENRLIPFVGAGASFERLKVDWEALRLKMCRDLTIDESTYKDPLTVATLFEQRKGAVGLVDLLKLFLLIDEHDDAMSRTHLCLLALNCGIIYTTNQDNVFEKMLEAKGRKYKIVINLSDLSAADPTVRKYIKYHGDLGEPDSVIFTGESYQKRISDNNHFLNIRMRADLLAKGFLFIGYSFNDPNVRLLFEEIRSIFPKGLPKSYLIAFHYNAALEELNKEFGVEIIDPQSCVAGAGSASEAFNKLLEGIAEAVFAKKSISEASNLFAPSDQSSAKVVIASELAAAVKAVKTAPFSEAVTTFRLAVDQANIPTNLVEDVSSAVKNLSDRVSSSDELAELPGILFNLRLSPPDVCIPIAWMMKAVNRHGNGDQMPTTHLVYPPKNSIVADSVGLALASLKDENQMISKGFLNHLDMWLQEFSSLPDSIKHSTKELVTWAYGGKVPPWTFDKPNFGFKTFDQIVDSLEQNLPKQFRRKLTD